MIRSKIALTDRSLRLCQRVDFIARLRHQPAWQDIQAAGTLRAFEDLARLIALVFLAWHTGDDDHIRLAVEEYLLDEIVKAVGLLVLLELEPHVLEEFHLGD